VPLQRSAVHAVYDEQIMGATPVPEEASSKDLREQRMRDLQGTLRGFVDVGGILGRRWLAVVLVTPASGEGAHYYLRFFANERKAAKAGPLSEESKASDINARHIKDIRMSPRSDGEFTLLVDRKGTGASDETIRLQCPDRAERDRWVHGLSLFLKELSEGTEVRKRDSGRSRSVERRQ